MGPQPDHPDPLHPQITFFLNSCQNFLKEIGIVSARRCKGVVSGRCQQFKWTLRGLLKGAWTKRMVMERQNRGPIGLTNLSDFSSFLFLQSFFGDFMVFQLPTWQLNDSGPIAILLRWFLELFKNRQKIVQICTLKSCI